MEQQANIKGVSQKEMLDIKLEEVRSRILGLFDRLDGMDNIRSPEASKVYQEMLDLDSQYCNLGQQYLEVSDISYLEVFI